MKKNKKNIYEKKEKFLEDKLGIPEDMASFIRILLTVVISFTIVYVIVIILGNNGVFEEGYTKPEISESTISYEDILYSKVFDMNDSEYYVIFSKFDNSEYNIYIYNLLKNYSKDIKIYKVDLSDGLNKGVISDTSNKKATKASQLKINTDTLIKIKNKKIVKYIEGDEAIGEELK
jgi:hypothetical protein